MDQEWTEFAEVMEAEIWKKCGAQGWMCAAKLVENIWSQAGNCCKRRKQETGKIGDNEKLMGREVWFVSFWPLRTFISIISSDVFQFSCRVSSLLIPSTFTPTPPSGKHYLGIYSNFSFTCFLNSIRTTSSNFNDFKQTQSTQCWKCCVKCDG